MKRGLIDGKLLPIKSRKLVEIANSLRLAFAGVEACPRLVGSILGFISR